MTVDAEVSKEHGTVKCKWFVPNPYELKEGVFHSDALKAESVEK
jgi:uncharacterized protein YodC (DUF2158 family)